jgi:Mce-associated membrane protein
MGTAATTVCTLNLMSHQTQRQATINDAAALGYVQSFMTQFTSPDPSHATDYTNRVLAETTGEFREQYRDNQNDILAQLAGSEPTTGTVLDAGVARRNDDDTLIKPVGSAISIAG